MIDAAVTAAGRGNPFGAYLCRPAGYDPVRHKHTLIGQSVYRLVLPDAVDRDGDRITIGVGDTHDPDGFESAIRARHDAPAGHSTRAVRRGVASAVATAGVDVDIVDVPAVETVTAVHTQIVLEGNAVAGADANRAQIDLRLAPTARQLTAVAAAEGSLTGQRVGVPRPGRLQRCVVGIEGEGR